MKETITLEFDGGSRGNPGPAGIGIVLRAQDGTTLATLGRFIGRATNNAAEYRALIAGDPKAVRWGWQRRFRNADVYARGTVRHRDHATITLHEWHRVWMNTENTTRQMANVAFLD